MTADKEERFKETFSDLATQYYVAARLAARAHRSRKRPRRYH